MLVPTSVCFHMSDDHVRKWINNDGTCVVQDFPSRFLLLLLGRSDAYPKSKRDVESDTNRKNAPRTILPVNDESIRWP